MPSNSRSYHHSPISVYYYRGMLSDVASVVEVPLDQEADIVRLLISGMYDANSPVSWSDLECLLELANKYDVEDIQLNCERFLMAEQISTTNFPSFINYGWAYDLNAVVQRSQEFIAADGNFVDIIR